MDPSKRKGTIRGVPELPWRDYAKPGNLWMNAQLLLVNQSELQVAKATSSPWDYRYNSLGKSTARGQQGGCPFFWLQIRLH